VSFVAFLSDEQCDVAQLVAERRSSAAARCPSRIAAKPFLFFDPLNRPQIQARRCCQFVLGPSFGVSHLQHQVNINFHHIPMTCNVRGRCRIRVISGMRNEYITLRIRTPYDSFTTLPENDKA
jgi:hypothetical protein